MGIALNILPPVLFMIIGFISLTMAFKSLFSEKFIPFHEKAAGISLDRLAQPLQYVIRSLMKTSGLGFLATGLLLLIFPIVNYFEPESFVKYAIPSIALFYCAGLFLVNYSLYLKTKVTTPWMGSLFAVIALVVGIILLMV
jgi:hypothetical protein